MPGLVVASDLHYGTDRLQRLDVYRTNSMRHAPVVVFIHGGAYLFGDKNEAGGRYNTLARYFVGHGMVFVNADYRLAPAATWPAGARDVGAIVAWVQAHIAGLGGDPSRIALLGHSAGATHVAGYLLDRRQQPRTGPGVAAAILVSGRYVLGVNRADPNNRLARLYFGTDPAAWADRSPIAHASSAPHVPVLIAVAGRENPDLASAADRLAERLRALGWGGRLLVVRAAGESHQSEIVAIGRRPNLLGTAILSFLRGAGFG